MVGSGLLSRRPPRWLRRLTCRLSCHQLQDRHFANGCLHLCMRCGWAVGVLPPEPERFRALRTHSPARAQQAAVDFLLAVLAEDPVGRDGAQTTLMQDPAAAVRTMGLLALALAPEARVREQLQGIAVMGELRAALGQLP